MKPVYFVKHSSFSIKGMEETEKGTQINGYASVFNNEDYHRDIIEPGSFKKTIRETKGTWPVLFNHDSDNQVGMNIKAKEDGIGLKIASELYTDDESLTKPKEVLALIKKAMEYEHPMGLSIGGFATKVVPEYNEKTRRYVFYIKEFQVIEHSITPIPANPKAQIVQVKNLESYFKNQDVRDLKSSSNNRYYNFLKNYERILKESVELKPGG